MLQVVLDRKVRFIIPLLLLLLLQSMCQQAFADNFDMTYEERIAAVNAIQLADTQPKLSDSDQKPDYDKSLFVDAGSFVGVTAKLDSLSKSDVLNSTLFAQLAASHDYDRNKDVSGWYSRYTYVLQLLGWSVSSFSENEFELVSKDVAVHEALLELISAIIKDPDEKEVLNKIIDALKKLRDDDPWLSLWNESAVSANSASFQMNFITKDPQGLVSASMGFLLVGYSERKVQVLFVRVGSGKTWIKNRAETSKLNSDVYNQVRDSVILKLGNNARSQVKGISID